MKKQTLIIVLIALSLSLEAQVGIGTQTPSPGVDLHVAGSLLVQDGFEIEGTQEVSPTEEDFTLITRLTNSTPLGEITNIDVNTINVAPINYVKYSLDNPSGDNLLDLDTQLDESKYIVSISDFIHRGAGVIKTTVGSTKSIGVFKVRAFISGGTWHIEIRNEDLEVASGGAVIYRFTLIIYDKKYYRSLPTITDDLGGSNTGVASSIPDFD